MANKKIELKPDIFWVGAIDWKLRDFHGYLTQKGTTYNAYLIIDEKVTLIDTVRSQFTSEMLERISEIIDPAKIDYVISNHSEMDHSGAIPEVMKICPKATLIVSLNGEKGLKEHYDSQDWNFKVVKSGESLSLGKRSLKFVTTPMVHWPDNMVEYIPEEKILFSNDSFGQHLATKERFDDELEDEITFRELKKYYANIVMPYGAQVAKELEAAKDLDIEMIAPSHGLVWRKNVSKVLEKYKNWSLNKTKKKAVVVFDTMWGSTEKMAKSIKEVFEDKKFEVLLFDLKEHHISNIMTDVLDAEYVCVGSPTLNNQMMPTVAAFLTYLKGLSPKKRKALAFGSYGWGGQSVNRVEEELKACGFDVVGVEKIKFVPKKEDLDFLEGNISKLV